VRRIALIVLALAAAVSGSLALLGGSRARGDSRYTFDAIFDDARGLISGQLIKIAGATAGSIEKVSITPDFKARIQMSVSQRFAPFHVDAHCTIRPQGLIAENYVECDPGSLRAPPLRTVDDQPPTVPVAHTTEPVSLLDLFDIANVPTSERFSIIVNELGIGLSGNGQDFNDIILRAAPALASARRVLSLLDHERAQLGTAIDASDRVVTQLTDHRGDVQRFVEQAAKAATVTADHRTALAASIARLPALLTAAKPALTKVDAVAQTGTPLLARIHAAVPEINKLTSDLGPFARAVAPVLAKLAPVLAEGTRTGNDVRPVVKLISNYARRSLPSTIATGKLFMSLRDHGFAEAFLSAVYYLTAATSRFDSVSHFSVSVINGNQCSVYVTTPVAGCSARIGGSATATGFTPATDTAAPDPGRARTAEFRTAGTLHRLLNFLVK
jgi:phospholipid/cholesterol/gamma-HCH transport system substrate-binding protein